MPRPHSLARETLPGPPPALEPREPLTDLPGVGPVRAERLARLGLATVRDLLCLVPRRLEVWGPRLSIAEALEEAGRDTRRKISIAGLVEGTRLLRLRRRRSILRVTLEQDGARIEVRFHNQAWLRDRFEVGQRIEVQGRAADARGPVLQALRLGDEERPLPAAGSLEPIYPASEGLSQSWIGALCRAALDSHGPRLVEPLPARELGALGLPPLQEALRELHAPGSEHAFERARRRVVLESALRLQARVRSSREAASGGRALAIEVEPDLPRELIERLPFEPTQAQRSVLATILGDLARRRPMRRLLQGDVGSGKTAVGLMACMAVARAGAQCAFLAPTELLAEQHHDGLRGRLEQAGLRAALLTGSLPASRRSSVLRDVEDHAVDVVFGTHALFSGDVRYRRLALVVIDEQHRFGVDQRRALLQKGRDVHALLMTATPIPRTLALTLHGDLDTCSIDELPPGRGGVRTRWVRGAKRRRIVGFLDELMTRGERAFWVCARIEDGQDSGQGAEARAERLSRGPLARHGLELVHGRLPAEERAARLERFRRGRARLLVATTVVEVGVDVPEATAMVIEEAQRLGLAQLHQLRGRVGRGPRPSWCLLLGDRSGAERFELLERCDDGFALAEEDLRLRGMGDLLGVRQAGEGGDGLGGRADDVELLLRARDLVRADDAVWRAYAGGRGGGAAGLVP